MLRRSLFALVALVALSVIGILGAAPAHAATSRTVSGTVTCANGRTVVGVWVESTAGGSGWANFNRFAGKSSAAFFTKTITTSSSTTSVKLHVGCGGSSRAWWSNNRTSYLSVTKSRVVNARCWEASGTGNRCKFPPKGRTTTRNLAPWGQCTYGALNRWRQAVGYYPLTSGNAADWDNSMASYGWFVSSVPHLRAFVIFERGVYGASSRYGHVGYVTGVRYVGSGQFDVTYVEMNYGAGIGKERTWKRRHVQGKMEYVVATI